MSNYLKANEYTIWIRTIRLNFVFVFCGITYKTTTTTVIVIVIDNSNSNEITITIGKSTGGGYFSRHPPEKYTIVTRVYINK